MKKLIFGPLAMFVLPQAVVWSFWALLRALGLDSPDCRMLIAFFAGLTIFISGGFTVNYLMQWIPKYAYERECIRSRLDAEREQMLRHIDEQVGIPRIPVKR